MKHNKKIVTLFILTGLLAGGLIFWQYTISKNALSEKDRQKAYKELLGRDIKEEKVIENNTYTGKNFSLKFPSNLSIKEATDSAENKTETLRMLSTDPRVNLVVMITPDQNQTLEELPSVKLRGANKDYKKRENPQTIDGQKTLVFIKTTEPEITAFFKKQQKIISISTSGTNITEVEKLFEAIIPTFIVQ